MIDRIKTGDELSSKCGDTRLDHKLCSPVVQWTMILNMLKDNGFEVVRKDCHDPR